MTQNHTVLVVGRGGREHALAWRLLQSPAVSKVLLAPGNGGTALAVGMENVEINEMDFSTLIELGQQRKVTLTLVGPEAPLAAGIVDAFQAAGLACFGPNQKSAQLEASKTFAKDFMRRHGIPTADYASFTSYQAAADYIKLQKPPIIVKADGLAGGKGVIIAQSQAEALAAGRRLLDSPEPSAQPRRVLVESFLTGEELSFIVITDGKTSLPFSSSQDHKRAFDGDLGPNTGGMGAYSPVPMADDALSERVMNKIIKPTLAGMAAEGAPFTGFLYAGLMISPTGEPSVVEFNCRFGDPEAQPVLLRLRDDLFDLCQRALAQRLPTKPLDFDPRYALGVVMASGGYPGDYNTGLPITDTQPVNVKKAQADAGLQVFHAGTKLTDDGLVTAGGRNLCITALAQTLAEASAKAYDRCQKINWPGAFYRTDIGKSSL